MFLVEPTIQYKESFLAGLYEFQQVGLWLQLNRQGIQDDFEGFIRRTQAQKDRTKIAPDDVPSTMFWLIDNDEFIGTLALRSELNDFLIRVAGHIGYQIRPSKRRWGYGTAILRLGLERARQEGVVRVLLTCDETNIASKKVIEVNGGQFENAIVVEGSAIKKLRYWINLE